MEKNQSGPFSPSSFFCQESPPPTDLAKFLIARQIAWAKRLEITIGFCPFQLWILFLHRWVGIGDEKPEQFNSNWELDVGRQWARIWLRKAGWKDYHHTPSSWWILYFWPSAYLPSIRWKIAFGRWGKEIWSENWRNACGEVWLRNSESIILLRDRKSSRLRQSRNLHYLHAKFQLTETIDQLWGNLRSSGLTGAKWRLTDVTVVQMNPNCRKI